MAWIETHWGRITPLSVLLYPFSLAFRVVVAARRAAYRAGLARAVRLPVPVVVIGNITIGGTGKTPLVLWLAAYLRERGLRPGIVSRGYGSSSAGPQRVPPDGDPGFFGDEPVLLARRSGCDVWTGRDRGAAGRALLAAAPACDVVIADDGLQHYGLARDLEVCLVDAARGLGNGWMLPAGPLREPPSRLGEVDAIVVNGGVTDGAAQAPETARSRAPCFAMRLEGREFRNLLNPAHRAGVEHFRGRRVHAVAGIGNPGRFFRQLQQLGLDFTAHAFPDHHRFSASDIAFAQADAVVMTEKDAVKCQRFAAETQWMLAVDAVPDPLFGELVLRRLATLAKPKER